MAITYTRAPTVATGEVIDSADWNKLADAFNDRLTQGVGDPTFRLWYYAHSLMRGIRNPDASRFLWPAEDEWWKFYAHIDPDLNPTTHWPDSDAGEPEGINVSNPMGAFVFGVAPNFSSESGRGSRLSCRAVLL